MEEIDESSLPLTRKELQELIAEIPEARTNLKFRNDVQRIMKEHRENAENERLSLGANMHHNTVQK